jgi:gliding motility-associated-like protein
MQKAIILGILLVAGSGIAAQYNYVPNSSFEDHTSCPTAFSQIERCTNWRAATAGTSDYLLDCGFSSDAGVPQNYMGYQEAHTGNAYGGVIIYSTSSIEDYKEYLEVELEQTLIAGLPYKVSFYCSLAEYISTYASEDLGAVLSPGHLGFDLQYTSITQVPPPIKLDGYIQNTTEWVKVEGYYTAIGIETHLTIGSFKESDDMDVMYLNPGGDGFAYYYIDDVSVEIDFGDTAFWGSYGNGYDPSTPSENAYYLDGCLYDVFIPNVFTPQGDNVNEQFFIKYTGYIKSDIVIVDRWGKTVFTSQNFLSDHWDGMGYDHGAYYYGLNMMKQDGTYDTFTGSIHIIGQ